MAPSDRRETYKEEIKIRVSPTKKTNTIKIKNLIPGATIIPAIRKVAINSIKTTTKKTFIHFQKVFIKRIKIQNKIIFSYKLMCFSVIASKVLTFKVCIILNVRPLP